MSDDKLPDSWATAQLADLVEIVRGVTYKKTESSSIQEKGLLPVLRANNIENGQLVFDDLVFVPENNISERQKVKRGDIVVAMSSGSLRVVGKTAQAHEDWNGGFGAFCGILRPVNAVSQNYVSWFTHSASYRNNVSELAAGVNINNLKPSHFNEIEIELAPLAEQKEIAARLDDLLAQVDSIKTRLDGLPGLLKRFRQSTLAAAVSGKLTEEWRGGVQNFGKKIKIGDVALSIKYGTSKKCSTEAGDIPVLRIPNIGNGKIDLTDLKFADFDGKEQETLKLVEGDILLIRSNGSVELVGKAALIDEASEHCLYAGYLIRIRVDRSLVLPKYLLLCLQSPQIRKVIEIQSRSTSGVNNINSKELSALSFEAPPIEEQTEIVRRVEELFAFAEQVEQRVKEAQLHVNHLTQSILAKAFRGELTESWRAEHPDLITGKNSAAALLERIKTERKKLTEKKKSRRK